MHNDDMVPFGFDHSCFYCKQPYGVHKGLCASCVGRFSEGAPNAVMLCDAEMEAAYEEEDRRHADAWHREQERRDFYDHS